MKADTEVKMVSMMRTAEDKRGDKMASAPMEAMAPDFPYGLCGHMDKDELDKLKITTLPMVGNEETWEVKIKWTRVSQSASATPNGSDESISADFQIVAIGRETDD